MLEKISDKTINCIAIYTFVFILIYEHWPYDTLLNLEWLNPIGRIFNELSYAYIGSYIFYKLLSIRDININSKKVKKSIMPILKECIEVYMEFLKTLPNYKNEFESSINLTKDEYVNIAKGISCSDVCTKYVFVGAQGIENKNYLECIEDFVSRISNTLKEMRWNFSILDDNIREDIEEIIKITKDIKNITKIYSKLEGKRSLEPIMESLFEYHKLVLKLNIDIYKIYGE